VFPFGANETVCDVFEDGRVEDEGFLLDQADLGSPPVEGDFVERLGAQGYGTVTEVKCL
jgi:hypothetical protein